MIFGNLAYSQSHKHLLQQHVWKTAFAALRNLTPESPTGITELLGSEMFINVHTYETRPESDCRFESHRHTIDIQYTITGGEIIQWAPRWELRPDGDYDAERDFQHYHPPSDELVTQVGMSSGNFVVLFPCDAHRPMIRDRQHSYVYKAVVKIDTSLVENNIEHI